MEGERDDGVKRRESREENGGTMRRRCGCREMRSGGLEMDIHRRGVRIEDEGQREGRARADGMVG